MKNNKWEVAQGASNLGEDDIKVAVYRVESAGSDNGVIKVAYCAYSGLKILEIKGVTEVLIDEQSTGLYAEKFAETVKVTDWEVGFLARVRGCAHDVAITINDCEMLCVQSTEKSITFEEPELVEVLSSEEYMADAYDELDIELLKIFCYI